MVSGDLLWTWKEGPFSSVLPVHFTSIARAVPFASQGFSCVPSPLEPLGQSCFTTAVALGAGALVVAAAGVAVAVALVDAPGAGFSSFEQPQAVAAARIDHA